MADPVLKIMAVTGSRADWGYLSVPLTLLQADPAFQLSLVVTGQHLDPCVGRVRMMLKAEGFTAAATVEMGPAGGSEHDVTAVHGKGARRVR